MKKRILFVDDDKHLLQSLQRALRSKREEWEMLFLDTGAGALEVLAHTPVDVVVTDMRMQGMNGMQLLSEIRRRHPEVVRLMHSGQTEREATLQSAGLAHQFLSKPCTPDTLVAMVMRTLALQPLLADAALRGFVSRITSLPSLPTVFLELVDTLQSPTVSIPRVSQIVSQDVGITAKLLQLINSGFFGLNHRVEDLDRAIALLGFDALKSLVLSVHLFSSRASNRRESTRLRALCDHSLTVGAYARRIARSEDQPTAIMEAAFTAGLLHDCGSLVFQSNAPELYRETLTRAQEENRPLWEAERDAFGTTHAEVGAYLLGLWGLSETTVQALAYHHTPSRSRECSFGPTTAVHAADAIAHAQHTREASDSTLARLDVEHLVRLDLHGRVPMWRTCCQAKLRESRAND